MKRWWTFVAERFPPAAYLPLIVVLYAAAWLLLRSLHTQLTLQGVCPAQPKEINASASQGLTSTGTNTLTKHSIPIPLETCITRRAIKAVCRRKRAKAITAQCAGASGVAYESIKS